jgi:hypothetical protein
MDDFKKKYLDFLDLFDAIYVINLKERTDRLEEFKDNIVNSFYISDDEFNKRFKIFEAINPGPGKGVLGCILSHIAIITEAKSLGLNNVLVFEDDAYPLTSVNTYYLDLITKDFRNNDSWDLFYLGYNSHKPLNLIEGCRNLLEIHNCYSTHAIAYSKNIFDYIIESKDKIKILDVWLSEDMQKNRNVIGTYPILFSQSPGYSDIVGKKVNYDFIYKRFLENTQHI